MPQVDLPLEHVYVEPEGGLPAPVVVVLHGRGADEQDLLPVAARLPDRLAVVSLRAPTPLMGGYTWYELDLSAGGLHASQPDPDDFAASLDLVGESLAEALEAYELDPAAVGLLGFSQGAAVSLALLVEAPERYAWCAALHGYLPASHADRADADLDGTPVFLAAGAADGMIPAERVEAAAGRLADFGADVARRTYDGGHGIGPDELGDLVAWVGDRLGS